MPASEANSPTITRTFAGHEFTVPAPYIEGHVLTAPEASWLNGQVASVVGNAFSGDLRRAEAAKKGATKGWDLAKLFSDRYASYALGEGRGSGEGRTSGTSKLERTINFLVAEDLKARIVAAGHKVDGYRKAAAQDPTTYKSRYQELLAASKALGTNKAGVAWTDMAQAIIDAEGTPDDSIDPLFANEPEAQQDAA